MSLIKVLGIVIGILIILPFLVIMFFIVNFLGAFATVFVVGMLFHPEWSLLHIVGLSFSEIFIITHQNILIAIMMYIMILIGIFDVSASRK